MEFVVIDLSDETSPDVSDLQFACRLLTSAGCCIGLRNDVAQELVHDVLEVLQGIAIRHSPERGPEASRTHVVQ